MSRKRERDRERESVCVCVCVCVRERERERERERICMFVPLLQPGGTETWLVHTLNIHILTHTEYSHFEGLQGRSFITTRHKHLQDARR